MAVGGSGGARGAGGSHHTVIDSFTSSGVIIDPYLSYRSAEMKPASIFSKQGR